MNSSPTVISPGCEDDFVSGEKLEHPSPVAITALILFIIMHVITFPFTFVLNALVMLAVKLKPRLRAHKSNILLALLASTDFVVGAIVQPTFIAVLVMFLLNEPSRYCVLLAFRIVMRSLMLCSFVHLALISGERYVAMRHSFAYPAIVTETRSLLASAFAWILPVLLHVLQAIDKTVFEYMTVIIFGLTFASMTGFHVTVYREARRHEQRLAAQQVRQEAREQFLRENKALKLTSTIIAAVVLCYILSAVSFLVAVRYRSEVSVETYHIFMCSSWSVSLLNSLVNPLIYSVRLRQFRVAFIELICRTMNIAKAEEIEMRLFGTPNAVVRLQAGQQREGQDQQSVERTNVNSEHEGRDQQNMERANVNSEHEGRDQQNMERTNVNNNHSHSSDFLSC